MQAKSQETFPDGEIEVGSGHLLPGLAGLGGSDGAGSLWWTGTGLREGCPAPGSWRCFPTHHPSSHPRAAPRTWALQEALTPKASQLGCCHHPSIPGPLS